MGGLPTPLEWERRTLRLHTGIKSGVAGLIVAGLLAATGVRAQDRPQGESRQQQIDALRKQIDELSKKLDELSKAGPEATEEPKATPMPEGWLSRLRWRPIGPANMGGRISAISVYEADPCIFWVATASGGLLKTENSGLTFQHQFDREATVSIGDVAVAQSDRSIVWVGTGEGNPRNSVSYGDGVYKSTDGGRKWKNMGLKESFQIGRIVVHPKDPDIVYVGALGRLYGPNPERGLFKTTDGGKSWEKVLYVDDQTGVIDIAMHPEDPDTLLVATYQRKRGLYDENDPEVKWGPGSGLHKTTDGGKTWTKLTNGLPTGQLGRIGIDYYRKDPKIVYAIVESEQIGTGPPGAAPGGGYLGIAGAEKEDRAEVAEVVEGGPAAKAGLQAGDVIVEADGKPVKAYPEFLELIREKKPGDAIKLKVQRAEKPVELEATLGERPGGGRGGERPPRDPRKPFLDFLGGQRENVQNRQGDAGPEYGGVYRSEDGGESWKRVNSLNPRPMYFSQIRVDPTDDKTVYVLGVQLYRSTNGGERFRPDAGRGVHADHHALWIDPSDGRKLLLGCDGGVYFSCDRASNWDHLNQSAIGQFYHVAVDSRRHYNVYGGLQDNGTWGGPSRTLSQTGPINEDWLNMEGGDGFRCQVDRDDPDLIYFSSQNGGIGRRHLKTGEFVRFRPRPPRGSDLTYRFNWNTPFILSAHNSRIYYVAGNYVFRSLDRGNDLRKISDTISKTDKGTATALAESPRNPNVLYVGTDDGALWVTKDGGGTWTEISAKVGLPKPMHVATIEASRFADGRVYVAFDGHRSDLDSPFSYVSEDFGETWRSLNEGLPRGSTRCLREDIVSPDVLYLGTEFGAWASIDRGRSWASLNTNLPTVAIHEFAVHPDPRVGEIVAATHGRSLWVLDASPLRQQSADRLAEAAYLYEPRPYQRWHADPDRGRTNRRYVGENPPNGALIYYHLKEKAKEVSLKVFDAAGDPVRTIAAPNEPGLHRALWDLARVLPRDASPGERAARERSGERGEPESESPDQPPIAVGRPRLAPPGTYRVVLTVDGKELTRLIQVEPDPNAPPDGTIITEESELEEEELEREALEPIID
jgi:photosystem II stability/assembly factor-like uncharacterized protein